MHELILFFHEDHVSDEKKVTLYLFEIDLKPSMGMSFFDSVLP